MCKGQLPLMVAWTNRHPFRGVRKSPELGGQSPAAHEVSAPTRSRPAVSLSTPSVAQPSGFDLSIHLDELPASLALTAEISSGKFPAAWVDAIRPLSTMRPRGHGQLDWQRGLSDSTVGARRDSHGPWVALADRDEPATALTQ
jgi:hypothetical protein